MARVWKAGEGEIEDVARLMRAFRDWWGYAEPGDAAMRAGVERVLRSGESEFLLAAAGDGGPPAGVAQVRYRYGVWLGAEDCWLEDVFVDPGARGRGLGRALVEAVIERARERGCRRVELDVNEANPAAIALYERLGFSARAAPPLQRNLLMRLRLDR
jgi:ribosomal protein S18 acetylase RimI-like enzyme